MEPCKFGDGEGFYDGYGELAIGTMFHGFHYPDETGRDELGVRFWHAKMENGYIRFPRPEQFAQDSDQYPMRVVRTDVMAKRFALAKNASLLEDDGSLRAVWEEADLR